MKSGSFSSFQAAAAPEARIGGERDDPPEPPKAIIVAEATEGGEVVFRVVCPVRGLSPLYRFRADSAHGNPYLLYGQKAAEWVGVDSWEELTLIVAQMTSGSLLT